MIRLYRHDGKEFLLNVDWISHVDSGAATVITLLNGEKITVKNTETDVITKIKAARFGLHDEQREGGDEPENPRRGRKFSRR